MKNFEGTEMGGATPEKEIELLGSWVQDIAKDEAEKMIMEKNAQSESEKIKSPEGSKYKIGPSRSGNENEVGIYFFDPTAKKENE